MARHIAKIRWDKQRPSRKNLPRDELARIRELSRAWSLAYRQRCRQKADAYRLETGKNCYRGKSTWIRSKRFPRRSDYLAWKHGKPPKGPTISMLWRPWIPPEYLGKPELEAGFVYLYRSLWGRVPHDVLYKGVTNVPPFGGGLKGEIRSEPSPTIRKPPPNWDGKSDQRDAERTRDGPGMSPVLLSPPAARLPIGVKSLNYCLTNILGVVRGY